jgi:hypothetical protein
LREKVERTEMREERKRPWSPGDGWDEEKLPSYFPFCLSFFFLSFFNIVVTQCNGVVRTNNLKGQRLRQCGCKETDRPRDFLPS